MMVERSSLPLLEPRSETFGFWGSSSQMTRTASLSAALPSS